MTKIDWENITNYIDAVGTTDTVFPFIKTQSSVVVKNGGGTANLIYTIGSQSGTLSPGQSITVLENITSMTLRSSTGKQDFQVWATEAGTEKDEESVAPDLTGIQSQVDSLETSLAQIVTVKKAVGNVITDTQSIKDALLAVANGGVVRFPDHNNYICDDITQILTDDITLDLRGSTLTMPDGALLKLQGETILTTTLTVDAARNSNTITVASAVGVQPGDIVYLLNNTVAETGWSTTKRCTTTVKSVTGNVIDLNDGLTFAFGAVEAGNAVTFYRPHKVTIRNLNLVTQTTTESAQLQFDYLIVNFENIKEVNTTNAYGIYLNRCVNGIIRDVYVKGGAYPFLVNTCRNMKFYNLHNIGDSIRHMVASAAWSADIYIDGVYGAGGLIESHPSFNVNYRNAHITADSTHEWNLRSIGGSIRDSIIKHIGTPTTDQQVQALLLTDITLWQSSKFVIENVVIDSVNTGGVFEVRYGWDITIKDCIFPDGTILNTGMQALDDGTTDTLKLFNNKGIASVYSRNWTNKVYTDQVINDAVLNNGYYEITSWLSTVLRNKNSKEAVWSNKGQIVTMTTTDPLVVPVKVYTQTRKGTSGFQYVFMKIKLTGYVRNNANAVDIIEKVYHAYINNAGVTYAQMGSTPAFASAPTGFTTEDLTMAIGNLTYSGDTQNTEGLTQFLAFDVTLDSNIASPAYSLTYEIEYFGIRA